MKKTQFKQLVKECIKSVISEWDEYDQETDQFANQPADRSEPSISSRNDLLPVEFEKDIPEEKPFEMGGQTYKFIFVKYPDGKTDVGIYSFVDDSVMGYKAFMQKMGMK